MKDIRQKGKATASLRQPQCASNLNCTHLAFLKRAFSIKKPNGMLTTDQGPVHLLVYTSEYTGAAEQLDADIADILYAARRNNARNGITGVLFHHNRRFLQFIEGPEHSVQVLLDKIGKDPRHRSVELLFDEVISGRGFSNWAMDSFNLQAGQTLDSDLLRMIRDAYRRNFTTQTHTLVGIYKGFVEQQHQLLQQPSAGSAI